MNRAAALLVLLLPSSAGACNAKSSAPAPATTPETLPSETPVSAPEVTRQLVTAITDDWDSTRATLRLWTRTGTGPWQPVGESWPAVLGRTGSAWGIGLHRDPGRPGPQKHEGDGKTPAGMFAVRAAYGYAPHATTQLPYMPADKLECVDDPASLHYTQIVDGVMTERDWKTSEQMRRGDALYTWVIDLAHNPARAPGRGSCIFLHVWGGPESTTAGCTAMDEARLVELLGRLAPAAQPRYLLLPRAEYQALAVDWDLPPP